MGSPLAPVLANIFMGFYESKWLNECNFNKPKFYLRYVDDILAAFEKEQDSLNFLNFLNNKQPNINPLSAKFIKWSNTLKQIVDKLPTICLSVFDHFSGLVLKGLKLR